MERLRDLASYGETAQGDNSSHYCPKDEKRVRRVRFGFEVARRIVLPRGRVNLGGEKNFEEAQRKVAKGEGVAVISNHLTYLDPPCLWVAMTQYYNEERQKSFPNPWDQIVFVIRQSLVDDPRLSFFLGLADTLPVYSRKDIRKILETEDDKEREEKIRIARETNIWAAVEEEKLAAGGHIPFIYVEGQRSKTGQLGPVSPHVAPFLKAVDAILPMAIWGTERILPSHGFPRPKSPVNFVFGPPYTVDKGKSDRELAHQAGFEIARLLPPKYRRDYHYPQAP